MKVFLTIIGIAISVSILSLGILFTPNNDLPISKLDSLIIEVRTQRSLPLENAYLQQKTSEWVGLRILL